MGKGKKTIASKTLSLKNNYYISQNRYLELKYFCLQYPVWKEAYESLTELGENRPFKYSAKIKAPYKDTTARIALAKKHFSERMELVQKCAIEADEEISDYILESVTEGKSYDKLYQQHMIPISRNSFYERRRRFFWLLNKYRE